MIINVEKSRVNIMSHNETFPINIPVYIVDISKEFMAKFVHRHGSRAMSAACILYNTIQCIHCTGHIQYTVVSPEPLNQCRRHRVITYNIYSLPHYQRPVHINAYSSCFHNNVCVQYEREHNSYTFFAPQAVTTINLPASNKF